MLAGVFLKSKVLSPAVRDVLQDLQKLNVNTKYFTNVIHFIFLIKLKYIHQNYI